LRGSYSNGWGTCELKIVIYLPYNLLHLFCIK